MKLLRFVLLAAAVLVGREAHAATITEYNPTVWLGAAGAERHLKAGYSDAVLISGEIEVGDAIRFGEYLKKRQRAKRPVAVLYLNSPGGSLQDAMIIGKIARQLMVATQIGDMIDAQAVCESACVFAFAGGVKRIVIWKDKIFPIIGLHRPYFDPKHYANLPLDKAQAMYREVIQASQQYMTEMEFPPILTARIFNAASTEMDILDFREAHDLNWTSPFLEEFFIARCGDLSSAENAALDYSPDGNFPPEILSKRYELDQCYATALEQERERIFTTGK